MSTQSLVSSNIADLLTIWKRLSEDDKARLVPELLDNIVAWHGWSIDDRTRLDWLKLQFEKAGVPFRHRRQ